MKREEPEVSSSLFINMEELMIYKKIEISITGYKQTADLYTYFLDNSIEMHINRKRPVVVICPGGGYSMTSDREAEPIAMQYLAKGYHAVILRYSVEPALSLIHI